MLSQGLDVFRAKPYRAGVGGGSRVGW
jgi:hypothetical protein